MIQKLTTKLLYIYIFLFPWGQLLRLDLNYFDQRITIHVIDCVVGLLAIIWLVTTSKRARIVNAFTLSLVFSYIFSLSLFPVKSVIVGGFYLLRILSYYMFYFVVKDVINFKHLKYSQLLSMVGLAIAVGGLVQYFLFPDLISLVPYGWDAHLFRLVGTFIDPGFTGLLLVLAFLFTYYLYILNYSKLYFVISVIIILSLLLTYSRASYLAFFISSIIMVLYPSYTFKSEIQNRISKTNLPRQSHLHREHRKLLIGIIIVFLCTIPFLPRPRGEGVRLERTASVYQRVDNYNSTVYLLLESPLFGVGYNNICTARIKFNVPETGLHSCSGTDSSMLLLLITTGFVGFITFGYHILKQAQYVTNPLVTSSFVAVLSHSIFQNSLLYPWVLGWFVIVVNSANFNLERKND